MYSSEAKKKVYDQTHWFEGKQLNKNSQSQISTAITILISLMLQP
jgi:hypothetical protein